MAVQWNKDADAALAEAKTNKKPVLVDFSADEVGCEPFTITHELLNSFGGIA